MDTQKIASLILGGITACCYLTVTHLNAWERTAEKECIQQDKDCRNTRAECKKSAQECKEKAPKKDEYNFTYNLSPYIRTVFEQFTPAEKRKAMDYADRNSMSPDDAVLRVTQNK